MKSINIALILILVISCNKTETQLSSSTPSTNPTIISSVLYDKSTDANNSFALDLHRTNVSDEVGKNVFTSPYSIYLALNMLWNGADGNSAMELQTTLRTKNSLLQNNDESQSSMQSLTNLDPKVKMEIANSVWVKNGFDVNPSFTDVLKSKFKAVGKNVPFDASTINEVNTWCANNTNQKITKIIDKFSGDEVMMLINAVYFNAPWRVPFDKNLTKREDFQLIGGTIKQVDMMNHSNMPVWFKKEADYQMAILGYGEAGKYSMMVIMPNDPSKFYDFERNFTYEKFNSIKSNAQYAEAVIKFPKVQIDYEKSLVSPLKTMGMKDLFDENKANLSKINPENKIFISDVFHKTYLKINEEGTEAAAITSIIAINTSVVQTIDLTFNKPFIIVIQENESNRILFMGRIINP